MAQIHRFPGVHRNQVAAGTNSELQRYVRITNEDHNGFVEFDFAIGDPSIFLEMILPQAAFVEFCDDNQVLRLTPEQEQAVDRDKEKWLNGAPADTYPDGE